MFMQVEQIFRENDIKYMVFGGILLGTVTTHKFIPWDDDFDRLTEGKPIEKLEDAKIQFDNSNAYNEVYMIWSASMITLDVDLIFPLRHFTFEGIEVTSFAGAEQYLSKHYGDTYKVLPPDELRRIGINRISYLTIHFV